MLWRSLRYVVLAVLCVSAVVLQAYVPAQGLWLGVWLTPLSGPGEARPPDMRRPTVEALLAQRR